MSAEWADLGNIRPFRQLDTEELKREIPLEWVLAQYGVQMQLDSSGTRLIGYCPFEQHNGPKFTVRRTEAGEEVAGCWACPDRGQGDLFEVIGWATGQDFTAAVQTAGLMQTSYRSDAAWAARPPVVFQPVPKEDPQVFGLLAHEAQQTAYADPALLQTLIDRKARTDPGWRRLTPTLLLSRWGVGVVPGRKYSVGLSNPDSAPYSQITGTTAPTRVSIPHYSPDGNGGWLVRGLKTRDARHGHPYAVKGSDLRGYLYGLWRMRGADWVLVCEGEGDAWCASAVPEIADRMDIVSVPTGVKAQPTAELLEPLRGKSVVLAFDGDLDGRTWTLKWVEALKYVAAAVLVAPVPDGQDLASSPDLLQVVLAAVPASEHLPTFTSADAGSPSAEPFEDPTPRASTGPDRFFGKEGLQTLDLALAVRELGELSVGADGLVWSYEDGVWSAEKDVVRERVVHLLANKYRAAHASNAEHVVRAYSPLITCAPVGEYINFRNGLYHWETGELFEHGPHIPSTVQLPVDLIWGAQCPNFNAFLESALPPDMLQTAWELIGYLMYSGNPLHKAVMLLGDGRNGKGTFLRTMTALLGKRNTTAVSLEDLLDNRFTTVRLFGKLANIAGDIDAAYLENTAKLKAVTGEDMISAEHKGRDSFDFEAWAVPVFSANKIPPSADVTTGYLSRWLVVKFPYSFVGREDRGLSRRISTPEELSGIAFRAVHALRDLMARGQFLTTQSGEEARKEFVRGVDQVHAWAEDRAHMDASLGFAKRSDLYFNYRIWAGENGFKALKSTEFYSRLDSSEMPTARSVTINGCRGYYGVQLHPGT